MFRSGFLAVERVAQKRVGVGDQEDRGDRFLVGARAGGAQARLWMGPPPPLGADGGQRAELHLNDRPLPELDLEPGAVARFEILLPDGLLRRSGNRLVFRFERASPADRANVSRTAYFEGISLE